MSTKPEYDRGRADGVRWAIRQIHLYAADMRDESARAALNTCADTIGKINAGRMPALDDALSDAKSF